MTFSILAKQDNLIVVAGASNWFAYGSLVPFISKFGAIATQAETNQIYGFEGLNLLEKNLELKEIFEQIKSKDTGFDIRQVGIIDKDGKVFAHTDENCIKYAGQHFEENLVILGNTLANDLIIQAMVADFKNSGQVDLGNKIINTLKIAEKSGGDLRGKKSAALRIYDLELDREVVNIRVDENKDPLNELSRLYKVASCYREMNAGDHEFYELENKPEAMRHYKKALDLDPENDEAKFWYAKIMIDMQEAEGQKLLDSLFTKDTKWKELWERIS